MLDLGRTQVTSRFSSCSRLQVLTQRACCCHSGSAAALGARKKPRVPLKKLVLSSVGSA